MADVFISYASGDAGVAEHLAELLTEAGYDVWWDRQLISGERFQRTIERQLAEASAVLVVWTQASVVSEWVYSEARRGSQRTALVQVRARDVDIDDLPAPFDGRHCPYVDDDDGVLRAVAALAGSRASGGAPIAPSTTTRVSTLTLVHSDSGGHRAFASAADAVRAALELPVTDGVGVHTGTPTPYEDGWIGMDATRAARLSAAASPGQVLLSEATAALVRDLQEIRTRDLGTHAFRELAHPEHLHQAERPGAGRTFPPIRSLGSAAGLPRPATAFLGRAEDLEEVAAALTDGDAAAVTLIGAGGIGKTRLALAAAERAAPGFDGGIYFVSLETVTEREGMWAAMGTALGLPEDEQTTAGVTGEIGHERLLLVLDNLEQLPGAGEVVTELLAACPAVRVLATSRGPLHTFGEREIALAPLDLETDAIDLFVRQARLVRRGFEVDATNRDDVLAICRALDCLPLALSLAAARLRLLSPRALRDRLGDVLDVTDRRHGDRHRTLRATIEWSYGLLSTHDQALFRGLAAFPGGARLEAVEHVAIRLLRGVEAFAAVESLSEASLVEVRDDAGQPRVHLLNTTRAFGLEALGVDGEMDVAMEGLAQWCRGLFEDPARWSAPSYADWARQARVADEAENIQASLEWVLATEHTGPELADLRLDLAVDALPYVAGPANHARRLGWLRESLRRGADASPLRRADALLSLAWEGMDSDVATSLALAEEGRVLVETLTESDLRSPRGLRAELLAEELVAVGMARTGDPAGAAHRLDELLGRELPPQLRLQLMTTLSQVRSELGDTPGALEMERAAAALARSIGDPGLALVLEINSGCSLRELGRADEAIVVMNAAIPRLLTEEPPPRQVPVMAEDYAAVLVDLGRAEDAALVWGAAASLRDTYGIPMGPAQLTETANSVALGRDRLGPRWDQLVDEGRSHDLETLLLQTVEAHRSPESSY